MLLILMIATEVNAEFPVKRARASARASAKGRAAEKVNPKFPGAIARQEPENILK